MPLRPIPTRKLEALLREHLSTEEDAVTVKLHRSLRAAKDRGYLRPRDLETVCYWKSPRAIRHIRSNSTHEIRTATRAAFRTRSEHRRLEVLTGLKGVSIPMASALLMLVDPKRYGVIDIRVWQLLHKVGAVTTKPAGVGFTFSNWYQFLMIIRHFAKSLDVKARDIERTLFAIHRKYQAGLLYDRISR